MIDHCTLWPDRIGSIDWSHCCAAHDLAYEFSLGKFDSDVALAVCVTEVAGWPLGVVMFVGVSIGGWLFYRKREK